MFTRQLSAELHAWKTRKGRKPLILRGARQVGKTTLVRELGKSFETFIELDLEKDHVRKLFTHVGNAKDLIRTIEGFTGKRIEPLQTLLFIDEIQNSVEAIRMLRYFYEEIPDLHVISAGSLLEIRMKKEGWSFPVGRVEFLYLYPATFTEFLEAMGESVLLNMFHTTSPQHPLSDALHEKTFDLLAQYLTVGGMPAPLQAYLDTRSFIEIRRQQEILMTTFKEDFQKYATKGETKYLKIVWDGIPYKMGQRVKYTEFDHSPSRAIAHALDILHEAMLVERIYPTVHLKPPLVRKEKAAPKILGLDIGLHLSTLGINPLQIKEKLLRPEYEGGLWESFIGQELLSLNPHNRDPLYFWIREEKGTSSELDFLFSGGNGLIPFEVKAGSRGTLKSLHQFIFRSGLPLAVRFYNGPPTDETITVNLPQQKTFAYRLLSFPLYLCRHVMKSYLARDPIYPRG